MKIGWLGLGKVGLPMALALAQRGRHHVVAHDPNPWAWKVLNSKEPAPRERGLDELLDWWRGKEPTNTAALEGCLELAGGPSAVVHHADVVFVAVQTPHPAEFDGTKPMPEERADFDYTALLRACAQLVSAMTEHPDRTFTIAVLSTVAPGTLDREVRPLLPGNVRLVYCPSFIRLGTVIDDFTDPDVLLLGSDFIEFADPVAHALLGAIRRHDRVRRHDMSIVSAEMTKLAMNSYQTMRITWVNEVAALCAAVGADVDQVTGTLADSPRVGSSYVAAGLGDGGPCRVRDAVVLDWLSREHRLGTGLFDTLLWQREEHLTRLAYLAATYARERGLSVAVMGKAYKAGTNLTHGSPALVLLHLLPTGTVAWDPYVDDLRLSYPKELHDKPHVFVIATPHKDFASPDWQIPAGSVVIDPWGVVERREGVKTVRYGRS